MKRYLIYAVYFFTCLTVCAQKENSGNPSVEVVPFAEMDYDGTYYNFVIQEKYEGEFEEDPIKFLSTYFDAKGFFKEVPKSYSGLEMDFRGSKGSLKVTLNANGEIDRTYHECKDILVPREIQAEIYRQYKGWTMSNNTHIATGKSGEIEREFFEVKLIKDGEAKQVKLPLDKTYNKGIAGHEN